MARELIEIFTSTNETVSLHSSIFTWQNIDFQRDANNCIQANYRNRYYTNPNNYSNFKIQLLPLMDLIEINKVYIIKEVRINIKNEEPQVLTEQTSKSILDILNGQELTTARHELNINTKSGNEITIVLYGHLKNSPPTISGTDKNLGDKNSAFSVNYSVDDPDTTDTLTVKEKINGITLRTLNNAPRNTQQTITVTEEMLYSYNLLATNTIEIEVDDGKGHVVYRRYTFKRTNTAPKIVGTDLSLGEKTEGFVITFSATDQENDSMSAKIFINDKLVETYPSIESAQEYTYTISKLDFVQLDNKDEHKIRIEVQDHNNATSIRNYTFTRKVERIFYAFEKETDAMATQILISPTWSIASGAEAKVLVCNNADDEVPTWEDATEQVLLERHFNFINTEKTGATWGIGVQIIINKGTATELSYLAGFGGAFK